MKKGKSLGLWYETSTQQLLLMNVETLISTMPQQMPNVNKWQRDFFDHHMGLFLSLCSQYT
ncbi:MAG: hypothetical protein NZM43_04085 [Saprospiraceae bacterium]|nr:hypothetical protein [Saprospiraceae bacterium]MDW8483486.1 hypothetical protein [Saprospiraceae bacterium]